MLFVTGDVIKLYQRHFNNLMSGIAMEFSFFRTYQRIHQIDITAHGFEQLVLSGDLIIGNSTLNHMAETVQLMVVCQVGKALFQTVDDIEGIQIPIRLLCGTDQINGFICGLFELGIGMGHQRIANGFDPLGEVTVLEYKSAVLALFQTCCNAEVLHTVARRSSFDLIVERLPLIGNHLCSCQLLQSCPERAGDAYGSDVNRFGMVMVHRAHSCTRMFDIG